MGIFAKLFNKNSEEVSSRNVEDFVSLTRVYFQSVIAANLGITNIRFVPDVANFKRLFKIPTQGGRLGQAEKAASRKMLMQDYGISESFFKEIDKTVWKKDDVHKTAMTVRQYKERLGYSEQWMTEYVYNIVMLAKKEPKKKGDEQEKA